MALLDDLKTLVHKHPDIVKISVKYQGGGDDGYVDDAQFIDSQENIVDVLDFDRSGITDWVYANLPGGWELNEGSSGEVIIDPVRGTANFDHQVCFTNWDDQPFSREIT